MGAGASTNSFRPGLLLIRVDGNGRLSLGLFIVSFVRTWISTLSLIGAESKWCTAVEKRKRLAANDGSL